MIETISKYLNIATLKKASIIAALAFVASLIAGAGEGALYGPGVSEFAAALATAVLITVQKWLQSR